MASSIPPSGTEQRATRPPRAWVIREPAPNEIGAIVDWSKWYVTDEEDMGESPEQSDIIMLLRECLRELSTERSWRNVYIGSDAFFSWMPKEPLVRVSPDVYLLDDAPSPPPRSWQTWKPGIKPPRFALEVVSVSWKKDYEDGPERYAALGCSELVIFDPSAVSATRRHVFTVFRRAPDGAFVQAYAGSGPAWSEELKASLVLAMVGGQPRVRVARDEAGASLVATASERVAELEAELKRRG